MGQNAFTRADEIDAIRCGIDLGMNVIDTAEMYSNGPSENIVDEAISNRRENVYLISKVLPSNASYQRAKLACENSLKRLKTDRIDLYLLHWQGYYPFEVTVKAMLEPKDEGKIIDWGVSNMDVDEMEQFFSIKGGNTCVTNEVLYNLT